MSVVAKPAESAQGADANAPGRTGATNAQESRADPTQVSGAETTEQPTRGPDYFRQAFSRIRGYTQTAAPAPEPAIQPATASSPAPQAPSVSSPPAPEPERSAAQPTAAPTASPATTLPPQRQQPAPTTPSQADDRIVLTKAELQRQAQAEADRILAKRQRDDAAKAERDREVELRRTNPFEYARLMEAKDQELVAAQTETKRLTDVVKEQLFHYDRNVLDIFVSALPEAERPKVIDTSEGIPGRKGTAANTLKALRTAWLAEGRASAKADLMKDQTFIKEILARYGQAAPEPESSPVQARSSNGTASRPQDGNDAVNAWMRSAARATQTGR
jgi:hypothetical protein